MLKLLNSFSVEVSLQTSQDANFWKIYEQKSGNFGFPMSIYSLEMLLVSRYQDDSIVIWKQDATH